MHTRGSALLFITIVLGTAMLVASVSLARVGLSTFVIADRQEDYTIASAHLEGCLQEVLIHTQKDLTYAASTVSTLQATCDVTFDEVAGVATIQITYSYLSLTLHREVTATLSPFALLTVE